MLEQRPYHYARWMIILQRWEPTISPTFPSLIPFWIKIQGLPVHLWTEATIKCIGKDIGLYEKAEITALTARMRVHINGLLPLITSSVVEYPNGDEVVTTLIYERLDKHCTKCLRLDHELKECLVARAETKALKATQDELQGRSVINSGHGSSDVRGVTRPSMRTESNLQTREQRSGAFQFSASNKRSITDRRGEKEAREISQQRQYKDHSKIWQERSAHRRSSQARERSRHDYERGNRPPRDLSTHRDLPGPPSRSFYREVSRKLPENRDTGSSVSKNNHEKSERGIPQQCDHDQIPHEVLDEARGELRDVMLQYTKCADLTEREARKERVRQAEEQGEMEETAIQMAKATLIANSERQRVESIESTPERIPANQRLGPNPPQLITSAGRATAELRPNSQERLPASLRLGPLAPEPIPNQETIITAPCVDSNERRRPVNLRLGPIISPPPGKESNAEPTTSKRRPGRPPGRKNQEKA